MGNLLAELSQRIVAINEDIMSRANALCPPFGADDSALYFRLRNMSSGKLWNALQSALNGSKIGRVGHSRARLAYTGIRAVNGTYKADFREVQAFTWEVLVHGRDLLIRVEQEQPAQWEFVNRSGTTFPMADVIHTLDCEVEQIGSWEWDRVLG